MKTSRAKLFQNGGSQAIRLPKECRFTAQREVWCVGKADASSSKRRMNGRTSSVLPWVPGQGRFPARSSGRFGAGNFRHATDLYEHLGLATNPYFEARERFPIPIPL
jgi:hypothetical protein